MKVAVLYICTGMYTKFFEGFYYSSEKYFLKDIADKDYFVFTDDMNLSTMSNVHLYYKKYEGFPKDSIFRFDMFMSVDEELSNYDYAYFFNSNMQFVAPVGLEFLPKDDKLTAVIHPGYYKKKSFSYPYERNIKSEAYIAPYKPPYTYYMGSLNGGSTKAFLAFAKECSRRVHNDYEKNIIAIYHDESHLNRYMRDICGHGLSPKYAYPEGAKLGFVPHIIIRDKNKAYPDCKDFSKGRSRTIGFFIKKIIFCIKHIIRWYIYL